MGARKWCYEVRMSKLFRAVLDHFDETLEGIFRMFFMLALAFGVFAWVAREVLWRDPSVAQFGEMARGSLVFAGIFGLVLLMKDSLGDSPDNNG